MSIGRRSLAAAILGLACVLLSTAPAAGAPEGRLRFAEEEHDFGSAEQEAELTARLQVTNTGELPITRIRPLADCGCYTAVVSADRLAPGAQAEVTIRFRTLNFSGRMRKRLRLAYRDGRDAASTELVLRVAVVRGVVVRPSRLYLGEVLAGRPPVGKQHIVWHRDEGPPFEIVKASVPGAKVAVEIAPFEKQPWKGWLLTYRYGEPLPRGLYRAEALIETTSATRPTLRVPISANVVGKVWLQSDDVYLGLIPKGRLRSADVFIRPFDKNTNIGSIRAEARGGVLRTHLTPRPARPGPGGSPYPGWNLTVTAPANAPVGSLDDVIELRTDVEGEEVVEVRVHGRVYKPAGR